MDRQLPKGVRQRGESLLVDVSYRGKRATATISPHSIKPGEDLVEVAECKRVELMHQLMNGSRSLDPDAGRTWNLGEAKDKCHTVHWSNLRYEQTALRAIAPAVGFFGKDRSLDTIDTNALDEYVAHLCAGGNADATINRKLASLGKVMSVAVERGGLSRKPKFPFRKEYQGRIRFFTEDEEAKMLTVCREHGWPEFADLIAVLIDTGMRRAEATALTPEDINLDQGVISVWITKTNRARSIPMTSRVRAIIKPLVARGGRLFPFSDPQLRHKWDTMRGHMGMGEDRAFVLHTSRHTCASRLVQRNVPLKVVQEWMGHTSITTTMRYAHLAPHSLMEHVNVLEQ